MLSGVFMNSIDCPTLPMDARILGDAPCRSAEAMAQLTTARAEIIVCLPKTQWLAGLH